MERLQSSGIILVKCLLKPVTSAVRCSISATSSRQSKRSCCTSGSGVVSTRQLSPSSRNASANAQQSARSVFVPLGSLRVRYDLELRGCTG